MILRLKEAWTFLRPVGTPNRSITSRFFFFFFTDRRLQLDLTLSQFLRRLYNQGLAVPGETCINLCFRPAGGEKLAERPNNGLFNICGGGLMKIVLI